MMNINRFTWHYITIHPPLPVTVQQAMITRFSLDDDEACIRKQWAE